MTRKVCTTDEAKHKTICIYAFLSIYSFEVILDDKGRLFVLTKPYCADGTTLDWQQKIIFNIKRYHSLSKKSLSRLNKKLFLLTTDKDKNGKQPDVVETTSLRVHCTVTLRRSVSHAH